MKRKKIAVLRANALGDFIFVLPALQLLRHTYPRAEIFYLGKPMHEILLSGRPGPVDHVIVIPPYPGVGEPEDFRPDFRALEIFFAGMQAEKFDIALQLHGGGKYSNPFVLRLGASLTVGLGTADAAPLDITIPYITFFNETLRYLEVVSCLSLRQSKAPGIAVTGRDLDEAREVLASSDPAQPFAVIHPGASDLRRRWPAEKFAQVADFLVEQGWSVYINGIEEERKIGEAIISGMRRKDHVYNVSGKVSLTALTGLLSMADLVISNDSGPLHVAYIVQTPAIGIYWVGNLITGMPLKVANNRPLISWMTSCPICGLECTRFDTENNGCRHHTSFVADVSVEEVTVAALELMKERNKQRRQEYAGVAMK